MSKESNIIQSSFRDQSSQKNQKISEMDFNHNNYSLAAFLFTGNISIPTVKATGQVCCRNFQAKVFYSRPMKER